MVGYDPGAQAAALTPEDAALAGSAAGFITRALVSPLDVLKIRFQVMKESSVRVHADFQDICVKAKYRNVPGHNVDLKHVYHHLFVFLFPIVAD